MASAGKKRAVIFEKLKYLKKGIEILHFKRVSMLSAAFGTWKATSESHTLHAENVVSLPLDELAGGGEGGGGINEKRDFGGIRRVPSSGKQRINPRTFKLTLRFFAFLRPQRNL